MRQTSFPTELVQWISALSQSLEIHTRNAEVGEWIEIGCNAEVNVIILAVMSDKWADSGSDTCWKNHVEVVRQQRRHGIKCVIVWDYDWLNRKNIVTSRIASMLGFAQGIAGRLTKVLRIDKSTAFSFLEQNHLNIPISGKYRYALVLPQRYFRTLPETFESDRSLDALVVAVATFSHARVFTKNDKPYRSFELLRFASLAHTHVIGGMDKIVRAFIADRAPDDIMTYADLEWSEGHSYEQVHFEAVSEIPPIAFDLDIDKGRRIPLRSPDEFGGIRCWNAGSIKYVRKVNEN